MAQSDSRIRRKRFVRKTKSERQREIIDATVELIGRHGVQGTTVSRIAQAAGIARGALYQHFSNREAVLEAAISVMDERSSAWIAEAEGDNPTAGLLRMAQAHSSWSQSEYNTFVRPLFQLIASHRESNLQEMVLARQKRDLQKLVKRVEEGQRQGTITSEVAATDVAWSLIILAWAEDVALLMGADELITQGASRRIAERLLGAYTLPPATPGRLTPGRQKAGGLLGPRAMAQRRALVIFSSCTGNTKTIAERFEFTLGKSGWDCDVFEIRKRADDILHPRFDPTDYQFLCVGSGIRSHLPYNEVLNVLRRFRLGADPRYSLRMRGETIPYITEPLPDGPPPWSEEDLVERHCRIDLGPDSPRAVVFVTYSGYEFGPKEAEPSLQLLELEIEHLGFRCVGRFSCPGKYLDHPMPHTYHGDIRHRPDERDLRDAQRFLEARLED